MLKIVCSVEESRVASTPYPVTVCLLGYSQGSFIQTGSVNLSEMSCTLGAVLVRCEQVMQDLKFFILHSTTAPFFPDCLGNECSGLCLDLHTVFVH